MADDIRYITFNNDELDTTPTIINGVPQPQKIVHINGTIEVNYTQGTYQTIGTNGLYITGGSVNAGYGGGGNLTVTPGGYQINYGGNFTTPQISISYSGKSPTFASSISYNVDPNNATSDVYFAYQPASVTSSTTPPVCFTTGTAIATSRGLVNVEHLYVGDMVLTVSGASRPVRWIGQRTIDFTCQGRVQDMPIRISAHAFGANTPIRDLYLSPGHPVLVGADEVGEDGHLVPIMCLINGTTIERVAVDQVTYWHVELDAHDILLAENLAAESYLDWGDRDFFIDGADHALVNPDFVVPGLAGRCRPVAIDGPVVEAERLRLDSVFASQLIGACAWPTTADAFVLS